MSERRIIAFLCMVAFSALITLGLVVTSYGAQQRKPREISKEEAIKRATSFAKLNVVTSVTQPQINYSHTKYFSITGNDEKGRVQIAVNPANGEIVRMVRLCPYPGLFAEKVAFQKNVAERICKDFIQKKGLPAIPKGYTLQISEEKRVMEGRQYKVLYRHVTDDIQVANDFMSFVLSGTGEVVSYSKVHHNIMVSTKPKISKNAAVESATKILGQETLKDYSPGLNVLTVLLKIVYPNHYFKKWSWEWSDKQALVWVVQFGDKEKPAIDVWVDAHTREIQGGEIYERPIPELIGIPNQTGDITGIWQPALDIMQYNTGTSATVLADTTEAHVVDAIADGFIFVLQTHGSTTATAEYARIAHTGDTDDDRFEPDEVPDNDLYYALVSCCHSGHDGSGDDFKDTFLDHGSLCFQGYEPSINPDPYERALVRYLAQGECLFNAHNLADADTSPWFDIIIRWQAWCLNAVYLAPLRVTIDAPTNASCTFTISATIYNGEAALTTPAQDVFAFLELPPGVTITSGPIVQNTSSIPYGSSWTASWTVSVPLFSSGSYPFDVIVWSDNLGVAVHDFDDPFHKFSVHATCPMFIPIHELFIRELFRWWYWADELYPRSPIPPRILKYRDTFIKKYRSDYLFKKDQAGFLNLMNKFVALQREFGKDMSKVKGIDKTALGDYMNSIDKMEQVLLSSSQKKIVDVQDYFAALGKLQADINEKATVAFGPRWATEKARLQAK